MKPRKQHKTDLVRNASWELYFIQEHTHSFKNVKSKNNPHSIFKNAKKKKKTVHSLKKNWPAGCHSVVTACLLVPEKATHLRTSPSKCSSGPTGEQAQPSEPSRLPSGLFLVLPFPMTFQVSLPKASDPSDTQGKHLVPFPPSSGSVSSPRAGPPGQLPSSATAERAASMQPGTFSAPEAGGPRPSCRRP